MPGEGWAGSETTGDELRDRSQWTTTNSLRQQRSCRAAENNEMAVEPASLPPSLG
jgi:hypothetical protein